MKKQSKPRHKRANLSYSFPDGSEHSLELVQVTSKLIMQFARMAESNDTVLRMRGREQIKMVAEFCVAGQFFMADQRPKANKPRGTIDADSGRTSATAIISILAKRTDAQGEYLRPRELRPEYFAALDELGLSPIEDKLGVTFDGGRTTWDSFRTLLARHRRRGSTKTET